MRPARRPFVPCFDQLEELKLLSTTLGYTPTYIRDAYLLNQTYFKTNNQWVLADGTGQTIAIIDAYHDPNLASDLATFDRTYGLPTASLTQVSLAGGQTNDGWAEEEALDVEWAHVAAPGAKIIVVEAASASVSDLMAAVNTARNIAGVSVVSMSWGSSEFTGETSYDNYFTTPAGHTPITFVAATGDSSAYAGAEWPASSPDVLSVGGTTLQVASNTSYVSESAWSGGGGGLSQVEGRPGYQNSAQSAGYRTTPDVSINADPNTGYSVYFTAPSTGRGVWEEVGGTSASAQVWAGFIADANQGRALLGLTTLNGATQTLPALYAMSSVAFHDVTSGSNGYAATSGYDLATGLGSPVANKVIPWLASYTGSVALTTTTVTTTSGPRGRGASTFLASSNSGSDSSSTLSGVFATMPSTLIPVTTGATTPTTTASAPVADTTTPSALPFATTLTGRGQSVSDSSAEAIPVYSETGLMPANLEGGVVVNDTPETRAMTDFFDMVLEMLFGTESGE